VQLSFYFLGKPPLKKEIACEAARRLRDLLQRNNIWVKIGLDPWFIADCCFPVYYAYQEEVKPPNERDYQNSQTIHCWIDENGKEYD
jgi:hypothetical protein